MPVGENEIGSHMLNLRECPDHCSQNTQQQRDRKSEECPEEGKGEDAGGGANPARAICLGCEH